MTNSTNDEKLMFAHGGYRTLESFKMATLVYDFTIEFCQKHVDYKSRTKDQMEQAARSGRQNIAEGSKAAGTSKKTEIKLTNVARASLEELLLDYEDFLRQHKLKIWDKNSPEAKEIRSLAYRKDKTNSTYSSYTTNPESFANLLICLIHQTNYLLDRQIKKLAEDFKTQGGFTERLYQQRTQYREQK
ncbi:MAG: four helix bundle suffix domain-containing protein [Candidatus Moranbacteria bacterium]|nr:four helix bundle suffix domain-containing protein [Candidatus Moranbacteria bacterium]